MSILLHNRLSTEALFSQSRSTPSINSRRFPRWCAVAPWQNDTEYGHPLACPSGARRVAGTLISVPAYIFLVQSSPGRLGSAELPAPAAKVLGEGGEAARVGAACVAQGRDCGDRGRRRAWRGAHALGRVFPFHLRQKRKRVNGSSGARLATAPASRDMISAMSSVGLTAVVCFGRPEGVLSESLPRPRKEHATSSRFHRRSPSGHRNSPCLHGDGRRGDAPQRRLGQLPGACACLLP